MTIGLVWAQASAAEPTPAESHCVAAYNENRNDELLKLCRTEADKGSYIAAFLLANLLIADNDRIKPDRQEAYRLYAQAAELASADKAQPRAQWILGVLTMAGRGTRKDVNFGLGQLWQAARANYAPALRQLGLLYSRGEKTTYAAGEDIGQDDAKAFQYFLHAAQQGDQTSQQHLAQCYETGSGTAESKVKAYAWYSVLAGNGDAWSKQKLAAMKPAMKAAQLHDADKLAKAFKDAYGSGKGLYDF